MLMCAYYQTSFQVQHFTQPPELPIMLKEYCIAFLVLEALLIAVYSVVELGYGEDFQ